MRRFELTNLAKSCALPTLITCLAIAILAQPASALGSTGRKTSGTSVACKRLHAGHIRCTMTVKRGAGISGTVTMRVSRGKVVFALGHGRVVRGKATLTMRVLHKMKPGRYTVAMVIRVSATKVLRLR
jgi:hypothetical protein